MIKVIYKKLGRQQAYGITWKDGRVYIDSRLKKKDQLETLVHEILHCVFPEYEEEEIDKRAKIISDTLWNEGFRKVDI